MRRKVRRGRERSGSPQSLPKPLQLQRLRPIREKGRSDEEGKEEEMTKKERVEFDALMEAMDRDIEHLDKSLSKVLAMGSSFELEEEEEYELEDSY